MSQDGIDGVDRDTPGARPPRALEVARRMRIAANDDAPGQAPADGEFPAYAELHCLSDFSFLRGAASAEELFLRAQACGYEALAITDECSLAGIVRAFEASRECGLKLVVGSEFRLQDGLRLVALVETLAGYTQLCELITQARRAAGKGSYLLTRADIESQFRNTPPGVFALWLPGRQPEAGQGRWLREVFAARAFLAVELHRERDDAARLDELLALALELRLQPVAAGDVHMDLRRQRRLQDTMTAIRHGLPLAECGQHLFRNGERHLRTRRALGNIYPHALLQAAVALARRCHFTMDQIRYRYPAELVPEGHTPSSHLRALTEAGMRKRWPQGAPPHIAQQIEKELALIAVKEYEAFFLTVEDIVRF
ncbi:MAG: PHP domain-containing protein, partial [Lysobacteraceae bacterium]